MRTINVEAFDEVSASASANSTPIYVGQLGGIITVCGQSVITGSAEGTIRLEYSLDVPDGSSGFSPSNWNTVTDAAGNSSSASVTSATDFSFDDAGNKAYEWIRAVYTRTTGSGTLSMRIKASGVTH